MSALFVYRVRVAAEAAFLIAYAQDAARAVQASIDDDWEPSMSFLTERRKQ
jgi:hypothetical protein